MLQIAVCAVVRDEGPYIFEWLAFHLMQGVQAFRIYDNGSADVTPHLLAALSKILPIERVDWLQPYSDEGVRRNYYAGAQALAFKAKFVAFIDVDEFLFCSEPGALITALSTVPPDVSAIAVNQTVFGSGGATAFVPDLVTKRFVRRAPRDHGENHWFKTIARPELIEHFDSTHSAMPKSGRVINSDGEALTQSGKHRGIADCVAKSPIRMNHYMLKSREEFISKKSRWRMGALHPASDGYAEKYSDGYFENRSSYIDRESDTVLAELSSRVSIIMKSLYKMLPGGNGIKLELAKSYNFL